MKLMGRKGVICGMEVALCAVRSRTSADRRAFTRPGSIDEAGAIVVRRPFLICKDLCLHQRAVPRVLDVFATVDHPLAAVASLQFPDEVHELLPRSEEGFEVREGRLVFHLDEGDASAPEGGGELGRGEVVVCALINVRLSVEGFASGRCLDVLSDCISEEHESKEAWNFLPYVVVIDDELDEW